MTFFFHPQSSVLILMCQTPLGLTGCAPLLPLRSARLSVLGPARSNLCLPQEFLRLLWIAWHYAVAGGAGADAVGGVAEVWPFFGAEVALKFGAKVAALTFAAFADLSPILPVILGIQSLKIKSLVLNMSITSSLVILHSFSVGYTYNNNLKYPWSLDYLILACCFCFWEHSICS